MLFPTHFIGGALAALCIAPRADPVTTLVAAAAGALAALLPDIDSTESFLGSRIPVLPSAVRMTVGHRGPLHSLAAAITLYLSFSWLHLWIFAGLPPELPLWILAGYVSHLLLDMFNPAGVPLLWPLPRRLGIPLIQTGGVLENLIAFPVVTCLYSFLIYKRMGGAYF